jgi:two-component system chemotaxis response regulator CheY
MNPVVILDDDADGRVALAEILRSSGHDVIELADGIDCIALLDELEPHALVLDLQMPVFDGERLLDYISAMKPALLDRIIIVSGSTTFLGRREWPVAAVLQKPVDVAALLRLLDEGRLGAR